MLIWKQVSQSRVGQGSAGLSLIEVMMASAFFAVGLLALVSAISSSMVVDTVAHENNLALDAARQVIEQVRSDGFAALATKVGVVESSANGVLGYSATSGTQGATSVLAGSTAREAAAQGQDLPPATVTWSGTPIEGRTDSVEVDEYGRFDVLGLTPCESSFRGKVGRIAVSRIADDLIEIAVTVRWKGTKGVCEEVLRCRIANCANLK